MNICGQIYNLIWILLAIGICIQSVGLTLWGPYGPGSGLIPFIVGLFIGMIGLLLFVKELRRGSQKGATRKFWGSPNAAKRVGYLLGGLCAMAYLMPILGFLITSFLVTAFMLYVIEPQKWFMVVATSAPSCLSVYFLFGYILQIPLPKGFLGI